MERIQYKIFKFFTHASGSFLGNGRSVSKGGFGKEAEGPVTSIGGAVFTVGFACTGKPPSLPLLTNVRFDHPVYIHIKELSISLSWLLSSLSSLSILVTVGINAQMTQN